MRSGALLFLALLLVSPTAQSWSIFSFWKDQPVEPLNESEQAERANSTRLKQAFGIALYEFQQGNYFRALVEISSADARDQIHSDQPNASRQAMKTLEAGIMLSYGMQNHAKDLISNVASKTLGGPQQDLAWFYLAQLYADKQDWPQAYQTIQKIGGNLPHNLRQKYDRLRANIYINSGRLTEAQELLRENKDPVLSAYTSFNMAVAEGNHSNPTAALSHLNSLMRLPNHQLDVQLLKDRAHLAAAQIYASDQNYPKAFEQFNQIKIDSPYSSEALFGQGWAAYYTDQPSQALASWELLQSNYALHPQSHKSRIALPFVYLAMDYPDAALQKYREAVEYYEGLMAVLESARAGTHSSQLFEFMNKYRAGEVTDWHLEPVNFPVTHETVLLGNLLEQQNIHEELTALAELYQLYYAVNKRRDDLVSFSYLIETSDQNYDQKIPLISTEVKKLQQTDALKKAENIRNQIAEIRSNRSVYPLMNSEERDYAKRVERSLQIVSLIEDVDKKHRYEQRIHRVKGLLLWNLSEAYPERIWELQKGLKAIDESIDSSQKSQDRLEAIITQHKNRSGPITAKVALFEQQLKQTVDEIKRLIGRQEQRIQQMFIIALDQKQEEIRSYLVHSHLAIARLTDKPALKKGPTNKPENIGSEPSIKLEAPTESSTTGESVR